MDGFGGLKRGRLVGLIAGAVVLGAASLAHASSSQQMQLDGDTLNLTSTFAPMQFAADGSVYGVRARGNNSTPTIQILQQNKISSSSLTPDPCSTAGFPGGWCMTPHSIAASAFGWDFSSNGKGVIIGIVDTGIDLNNPEFTGRVLKGDCIVSSVNPCTSADNKKGGDLTTFPGADSTHGTHVSGIAAGTNTGLAYQASILPVKVCGSDTDECIGAADGTVVGCAAPRQRHQRLHRRADDCAVRYFGNGAGCECGRVAGCRRGQFRHARSDGRLPCRRGAAGWHSRFDDRGRRHGM